MIIHQLWLICIGFTEMHMWLKYCPLIGLNSYVLLTNFTMHIYTASCRWLSIHSQVFHQKRIYLSLQSVVDSFSIYSIPVKGKQKKYRYSSMTHRCMIKTIKSIPTLCSWVSLGYHSMHRLLGSRASNMAHMASCASVNTQWLNYFFVDLKRTKLLCPNFKQGYHRDYHSLLH